MNKNSETNNSKKYYVLFETDEDGIRQFRTASAEDKKGVTLSTMRVEGKKVPAFKIEVDKPTYDHFKRILGHCNPLQYFDFVNSYIGCISYSNECLGSDPRHYFLVL